MTTPLDDSIRLDPLAPMVRARFANCGGQLSTDVGRNEFARLLASEHPPEVLEAARGQLMQDPHPDHDPADYLPLDEWERERATIEAAIALAHAQASR